MAISVIVTTCNSARHIDRVLRSVKGFDEVIVCDCASTDDTCDIVRSHGVTLRELPEPKNGAETEIRRIVLSEARSSWVLVLHPDELVTPALKDYLYSVAADPGECGGLYIPRKTYVMHRLREGSYPDYQLRFFKRDYATWQGTSSAEPKIRGKVRKISARSAGLALIRQPKSLASIFAMVNRDSSADVKVFPDEKPVHLMSLFWTPSLQFIKEYFFKARCRYGVQGYLASVNKALHTYYTMAKAYEDRVMPDFYARLDRIIAGEEDPVLPPESQLPDADK